MRCDIIIPIWNQLDITRSCIDHIIENTRYPYRLILIDNASDLETKKYLDSLERNKQIEMAVIRNEENLGFVKAVNQGLSISKAPYVCVLNNDTCPAPGWLERMIDFAKQHEDVGLINPQCDGHGDRPIDVYAGILKKDKGKYMEMNQCQGFCMLVKRELIDKIGGLDESFGIGGFDDTDFSMRAHMKGYRCVSIKDAYVYHHLHVSFNKSGDREKWVKKNRSIYYEKWGKHLRTGMAVTLADLDMDTISHFMTFAYGLAREWSWVHLWINFNGDKGSLTRRIEEVLREQDLPPHQNIGIRYFNLPDILFKLTIAAKLLERTRRRSRDKAFDAIVASYEGLAKFISPFARIAQARILDISFSQTGLDWQDKGRQTALSIKRDIGKNRQYAV